MDVSDIKKVTYVDIYYSFIRRVQGYGHIKYKFFNILVVKFIILIIFPLILSNFEFKIKNICHYYNFY